MLAPSPSDAATTDRLAELRHALGNIMPVPDERAPFPMDALPEPMQAFCASASESVGASVEVVALPLLASLAGAIGNTRAVELKPGWIEPTIVWGCVVAPSGSAKTPGQSMALRFIREADSAAWRDYLSAKGEHEAQGDTESAPPQPSRLIVSDATTEALARVLEAYPRGVLLAMDELSGLLAGFNAYRNGKGADAQRMLSMWSGEPMLVDRVQRGILRIERPAVSICGTTQPDELRRVLGREHLANGMASRILMAMPECPARYWTDCEPDPIAVEGVRRVFESLLAEPVRFDALGRSNPLVSGLTTDALNVFKRWHDEAAGYQAQDGRPDAERAVFSKGTAYGARLALVIHAARCAAGDVAWGEDTILDADSMRFGCRLAAWFCAEGVRVLRWVVGTAAEGELAELAAFASRRTRTTAREVQRRFKRRYATTEEAQDALALLVETGDFAWDKRGEGQPGPASIGVRPVRELSNCQLSPASG